MNTAGAGSDIAQNTWIEIKGKNLVPANTPSAGVTWSAAPEFASGRMPTQLNEVSVKVNGKPGYVYFLCSATTSSVCDVDQINVLTPLDNTIGRLQVSVTNGTATSTAYTLNMRTVVPSFLLFSTQRYVVATHANFTLLGPQSLYPGLYTPALPNESISIYGVGFGLPATSLIEGSSIQSGSLPSPVVCQIGGMQASVTFAGLISPGLYQLNVGVPGSASGGDNPLICTYSGSTTPDGDLLTIQK